MTMYELILGLIAFVAYCFTMYFILKLLTTFVEKAFIKKAEKEERINEEEVGDDNEESGKD